MSLTLNVPQMSELKPKITVFGVGGAGGNAVNNMIEAQLEGVEFVVANTDSQALAASRADRRIQLGRALTQGLGAGSRPDIGAAAADEAVDQILDYLQGSHMVFITAGMGGGTGTGAAPVIARLAREQGILTVGVVTKPFKFEGTHRMNLADRGVAELQQFVDTLIIIPNQNLFRIANEKTTFAQAFAMADNVLHSGVRGVTDLMVMPGLINLDFADVRTVMSEMGKAIMGTGEASGEKRAHEAAEAAISNPLLDEVSMKGARGVLINITGGSDLTLFEVDEAAGRIREEVDPNANIIVGSAFDPTMDGRMRVSVVATGIDVESQFASKPEIVTTATITPINEQKPRTPFMGNTPRPRPMGGGVSLGNAAVARSPILRQEAMPEAQPVVAAAPEPIVRVVAEQPAPQVEAFVEDVPDLATPDQAYGNLRFDMAPTVGDFSSPPAPVAPRVEPLVSLPPISAAPADAPRARTRNLREFFGIISRGRAAEPPRAPEPSAHQPGPRVEPQLPPMRPEPAHRVVASRPQEDQYDIPAFLRRQAN